MNGLQQARILNTRADVHMQLGNTLLASWLRENAIRVEQVHRQTERALNKMALGQYEETSTSRKAEYTHQWYAYEEEYAYNFNGLQ